MPTSKLFALQAQRATLQARVLARDMQGLAQQADQNRQMQGRIDVLLDNLEVPAAPVTIAHLRSCASLGASLVAELERQRRLETEARSGVEGLMSDLQGALRQKRNASQAAERFHRQESKERAQRQDRAGSQQRTKS